MKIAPIDLVQKTFTQAFRGYEAAEVTAFLEQVRDEMEENLKRIRALEVDLASRERELKEFRERDQSLRDTLVMAQRMSEDIRENAQRQADLVVKEARLRADQIEAEALRRRTALLGEVDQLKALRTRHLASVRSTLETHRTLLEAVEAEMRQSDQVDEKVAFLTASRDAAEDGATVRPRRGSDRP